MTRILGSGLTRPCMAQEPNAPADEQAAWSVSNPLSLGISTHTRTNTAVRGAGAKRAGGGAGDMEPARGRRRGGRAAGGPAGRRGLADRPRGAGAPAHAALVDFSQGHGHRGTGAWPGRSTPHRRRARANRVPMSHTGAWCSCSVPHRRRRQHTYSVVEAHTWQMCFHKATCW